jgi:endonuclease/exonuclease/phosphatase family metal-dependent hydrolase
MVIDDPTLNVMSFNIRCDTGKAIVGDPDCWKGREPILRQFLSENRPDILGVQELMYHQIPAIQEGLSSKYSYIGESRDSSKLGELGAIFYNTERLTLCHWDQCWLSDDPTVPESNTWGNDVTRIVTWGTFKDNLTDKKITISNTHFDHISEYSRIRSAEMLVNMFDGTVPVVLMGDFNADSSADTKEYDILTTAFQDTLRASRKHLNPDYGTFSDYKEPSMGAKRIDWILSSQDIAVKETSTHTFNVNGRYPSDHLPISARLELANN